MKPIFIVLIGIVTSILVITTVHAHGHNEDQCNANNPKNCPEPSPLCDNGEHVGNPHCITPTPTEDVSPTPEDEVSPTPTRAVEETATPSATPTPEVEEHHDGGDGKSDGLSSCPSCTQTPQVDNRSGMPLLPPSNSPK